MDNPKTALQKKLEVLRKAYLERLPGEIRRIREEWNDFLSGATRGEGLAELHRRVHSITGSSSTFGFTALSQCTRKLEKLLKSVVTGSCSMDEEMIGTISGQVAELTGGAFEKPLEETELTKPGHYVPRQSLLPGERMKKLIFLVEDDLTQLRTLAMQIAHFGYAVKKFSRLEGLDEAVRQDRPSAIIMDVIFPEGNFAGIEMVKRIRGEWESQIPVVFISVRIDLDARLQAVRAGGEAYFVKPVNIIELIEELDVLTNRKEVESYRVLIIEDEIELGAYYASILNEAGMVTAICNKPLEVLDPLIDFKPDLILMDMYMPECNGQELAKIIRQMHAYISIPIVFLSSETDIRRQLAALSHGGDDFLVKPIQPEHLISSVAIRAERMRIMRSLMELDGLTGLLNHTRTNEQLNIAVSRAARLKGELTLAMIDIDRFKTINDTYGHPTGDRVLVAISRLLQQRLRKTDILGRLGGEEFAVIMSDTGVEMARQVVDEIRASFAEIRHQSEEGDFSVTFSCGLAGYPRHVDAGRLFRAADKALYRAKREGRNRVIADSGTEIQG